MTADDDKKAQDQEKLIVRLTEENERLKRFRDIGAVLGNERDIDTLIPLVMAEISKALNADRSTMFLMDWDRMELWTKFAEGLSSSEITLAMKIGLVGQCVLSGSLLNVPDAYDDMRFNPEIDQITGVRTERVLCVPYFDKSGLPVGAIELINKKTGPFIEADEEKTLETAKHLTAQSGVVDSQKAQDVLGPLTRDVGCDYGSVFYLNRDTGDLSAVAMVGLDDHEISISMNLGIAGLVAVTGRELNITDAHGDPRFNKSADQKTGYHTKCMLCVPLKNSSGETLGALEAINKKDGVFSDADMEFLKALSYQVSIFTENAILFKQQRDQFNSVLKVLAASVEAKDHLTSGHSQRVSEYAVGIAIKLGFGESEIEMLSVAGMLHDYGKLGTDDNILKKPGKLTDQEFEHIKEHAAATYKILDEMNFIPKFRSVPFVASSHHERLDGSGYPNGLKDKAIPLMSKILSVADVFEAMTADRHYRKAMSPQKAIQVLDEGKGSQFDENVVDAFKEFWSETGEAGE